MSVEEQCGVALWEMQAETVLCNNKKCVCTSFDSVYILNCLFDSHSYNENVKVYFLVTV